MIAGTVIATAAAGALVALWRLDHRHPTPGPIRAAMDDSRGTQPRARTYWVVDGLDRRP